VSSLPGLGRHRGSMSTPAASETAVTIESLTVTSASRAPRSLPLAPCPPNTSTRPTSSPGATLAEAPRQPRPRTPDTPTPTVAPSATRFSAAARATSSCPMKGVTPHRKATP